MPPAQQEHTSISRDAFYRIAHYPSDLIDAWRNGSGRRFTLRPVLPQDAGPLGELMRRLSAASRYDRYHAPVKTLTAETLRDMAEVDYRQHLAIVVTTIEAHREVMVADARYVVDPDGDGAEFAIVVGDAWQRIGIGERMVHALSAAATRRGLRWLYGSVLRSNATMLSLMRRCGYCCTSDGKDRRLVHVEKLLVDESRLT